jgi:glycosyltransferase involved in cell wall biosynthesis
MGSPLVSIIIPCRNGEGFIGAAIASALAQTYARTEIIVIDDGSTDSTLDVIRSFGDRVLWESGPNQGASRARNRGLALARGEVVQFLDADDRLYPTKIAAQLDVMGQSCADSVYCDAWAHEMSASPTNGRIRRHAQSDDSIIAALGSNAGTTAGLHRREIVENAGGFDESLPCAQERDLHLRLACLGGKAATLPKVLVDALLRPGSVSSNGIKVLDQHEKIVLRAHAILNERGELTEPRAFALARFLANASRVYSTQAYAEQARRYWRIAMELNPAGARSVYSNTEWPLRRLIGAGRFDQGFSLLRRLLGRA